MSDESRPISVPELGLAEQGKAAAIGAAVGAIGIVPVIGPVVSGIVGSFVPDAKLDRAVRFLNALALELREVEGRVDEDFIHREEFAAEVEDVLDRIIKRKNDAKLRYFAAAIAASSTVARPTVTDRERFVDLLDELRPSHLAILAGLSRGMEALPSESPFTVGAAAYRAIAAATADSGSEDVNQDLRDLEVRGLVHAMGEGTTMMHVARDVRSLLTPSGQRFVEFAALSVHGRRRKSAGKQHRQ